MHLKKRDQWIRYLDWGRLIVALGGLIVACLTGLMKMDIDYNWMLSNTVGLYVLMMGIKVALLRNNRLLAYFYIFFSLMMLLTINMIHLRFG